MSLDQLYFIHKMGKEFQGAVEKVTVLNNIDLEISRGESVAIVGASGSGKSTLLHLLGMLDVPSWGEFFFNGQKMDGDITPDKMAGFRNREMGFVFQFHHLLPEFTTLENVAMPGFIRGLPMKEAREAAAEALGLVGLEHRFNHRVTTLSGGERQRAAIARAIVLKPKVLLADEPTGSLDEKTGARTAELLASLNAVNGLTLVVVTHNHTLARLMRRRFLLQGGELYAEA